MKIVALSDMHGHYDGFTIEPSEVMVICGDVVPVRMQRNIPQSFKWLKNAFIPWIERQPIEKVFMVFGNHDFFAENEEETKRTLIGTKITALYNESVEYLSNDGNTYSIFGSPLCHIFGKWAFMMSDEYNKEQYLKMPNDLDILITHDGAYGHSDQCLGFSRQEERDLHRGNIPLKEVVEEKKPRYHLFGHLHTCDHNVINYDGTKTACVSLLNELYDRVYDPLYLDITKQNVEDY